MTSREALIGGKVCRACRIGLPHKAFYVNKKARDRLGSYCKECDCNRSMIWIKDNPDKARDTKLRRRFDISLMDYNQMLEQQGYKCAICRTEVPRAKGVFNVDHSHDTGKVRGLLCHSCNTSLGHLKDSPTVLASSLRYLHKHGKALSSSEVVALFDDLQLQPHAEDHSENSHMRLRDGQPAPCDDSSMDAPAG